MKHLNNVARVWLPKLYDETNKMRVTSKVLSKNEINFGSLNVEQISSTRVHYFNGPFEVYASAF